MTSDFISRFVVILNYSGHYWATGRDDDFKYLFVSQLHRHSGLEPESITQKPPKQGVNNVPSIGQSADQQVNKNNG